MKFWMYDKITINLENITFVEYVDGKEYKHDNHVTVYFSGVDDYITLDKDATEAFMRYLIDNSYTSKHPEV